MTAPRFVGIAVAKDHLDVHIRPDGTAFRVPNDDAGLAAVVDRLRDLPPALVVLEATGGYEAPVAAALARAGLPVAIVNPRQVRAFAHGLGKRAKTDPLDAAVLAHFGEVVRPPARPLPDADTQLLQALLGRRRPLLDMRTAERNRLTPGPRPRSARGSRSTWRGSTSNARGSTRSWPRRSGRARCGAPRRTCCGASRGSGRWCPPPSWRPCRNSAPGPVGRSGRWPGGPRSTGTAGGGRGSGRSAGAGRRSGQCFTWRSCRPPDTTR